MMVVDDNLVSRIIHMYEKKLDISFGKIFIIVRKWYTWEGMFHARTVSH